ncbi:MAG: hypothetical protein SXU28_02415 [Pseudomonadota bacterium]|nr:hypothetical protein [Pseudomonadota bacterium]
MHANSFWKANPNDYDYGIVMRFIGTLFLGLAFLAGITVASLPVALVNVIIFILLALFVVRFLAPRFGQQGVVYGMAGAFFASILWPFFLIPFIGSEDCEGDQCLAGIFTTPGTRQAEETAR